MKQEMRHGWQWHQMNHMQIISISLQRPITAPTQHHNFYRPVSLPGRPRTTWMKNIHENWSSLDLGIYEARDLAQTRPLWRLCLCTAPYGGRAFAVAAMLTRNSLSKCLRDPSNSASLLAIFSKYFSSQSTNVYSALEALARMHYIN